MPQISASADAPVFQPAKSWLRALEATAKIGGRPDRTLPIVIDELGERFGSRPALISDRETLSFADLAARARRYARWALDQKLAPGDTVALLMPNCPDFLAIWLGVSRVGAVAALLNTNLAGPALAHCIAIVEPRHVIVSSDLTAAYATAARHLGSPPRLWVHSAGPGADGIDVAVARMSGAALTGAEQRPVSLKDRALCIYTSGTTGLPKAANVSHHRVMMWSHWFAGLAGTGPDDRLYNCLPMYHSVGGVVAVGSVLVNGGACVIREKFSASRFWEEIERFDCTLFQYIGEICRYLLKAPAHEAETRHRLRLCCGNGLRADVWAAFQERFRIPHILEFYAATEANFSLYNVDGKVGAIGRIPSFLAPRFPAALVRHDIETGLPARGPDGLCIRCARNEPGEAISRIGTKGAELASRFEGYTSQIDTDKKVLRDVFAPGDAWFRTGDLMRLDEKGFFYFIDRIGDTFRWKGENVATSEVAEAVAAAPGIQDVNVYGVEVPGTEGRAGMAAIVIDKDCFTAAALYAHLLETLPPYARPLFLRVRTDIEITETFKQKKQGLIREGFDPALIAEPLYVADAEQRTFVPLDGVLFEQIGRGRHRL